MREQSELDARSVLESLHRVALATRDASDPDALYEMVGREARELLCADDVLLYIWDEDQSLLRLAYGEHTGHAPMQTMTVGQGAVGQAFESGEPTVVTDYPNWPGAIPQLVERGVKRVAAVPLRIDSRTVGVLAVRFLGRRGCQTSHVRALQLFAAPVAAILDVCLARHRAASGEARLWAIVDHLPVGVVVRDAASHVVLLNQVGRNMNAGPEPISLEEIDQLEFVDPASGRALRHEEFPTVRALHGEHVIDHELRVRRPGGDEWQWMRISAVPLPPGGSVAIFADVSRERQLLLSLRLSASENSRLLLELRDAQRRHRELLGALRPTAAERSTSDGLLGRLSTRELEVLGRLGQGQTNRQIGEAIGLSPGTVKKHVEHILRKLDVTDRTQAAVRASELGLSEGPD